ncbi:MAG: polysaccharide pyruvyl transferase CsaB [Cyanothece sp. SIO2G6]|nr:polysaccharide pyruvyl transferase CsaB [Cyanothece sp. SIO2G6]
MQAVLCGYYGMGNGGDEALLAVLLEMLPAHVTPIVLSGNPAQTAATYGVTAYHRKSVPQVLQAFQQAEVFIWGGGSLMQDVTSPLSPLYYGGLMLLAQKMGLKTIAWAQGIGPLERSPTRWLTRYCLTHCTAVSVRDQRSADLVKGWGIKSLCAPDPVWAMSPEPGPEIKIDHTQANTQSNTKSNVAVILRPHPLLTEARLTVLTQALIQFQSLTQTHLLLVPFQPVTDRAIAHTIHSHLPQHSQIVACENPRQLHGLFETVDFAIAMRLHGVIMAAAAGCRCWAISYDPKVSQLMQALNIPGWELAELPSKAITISETWHRHYRQGTPLVQTTIKDVVDCARLHRNLLQQHLSPASS